MAAKAEPTEWQQELALREPPTTRASDRYADRHPGPAAAAATAAASAISLPHHQQQQLGPTAAVSLETLRRVERYEDDLRFITDFEYFYEYCPSASKYSHEY